MKLLVLLSLLALGHAFAADAATWSASSTWYGGAQGNPEQSLYRVYLDDGGSGVRVTITGLAAWMLANGKASYSMRGYAASDKAAAFRPISIRSGAGWTSDPVPLGVGNTTVATAVRVAGGTFAKNHVHGEHVELVVNGVRHDHVSNYYVSSGNDLVLEGGDTRLMAWGSASSGQLGLDRQAGARGPTPVASRQCSPSHHSGRTPPLPAGRPDRRRR